MLEFKVVIEKNEAIKYLEAKKSPVDISPMMVMVAADGDNIVGVGALSLDPSGAVIEEIVCDDDTIAYGMGKAMLNSLDLGGIRNARIKNSSLFELAKRLRFEQNQEGSYALDLEGYFYGGCH